MLNPSSKQNQVNTGDICQLYANQVCLLYMVLSPVHESSNTIQYKTVTLFNEGDAITYYNFLTYNPRKLENYFEKVA